MITIRKETLEDIENIKLINDLAFKGEGESKLVQLIRESENFVPEFSLVAVNEENDIVGHILFSIIHIETNNGLIETIGLAPMAVHPSFQNQGIGSNLVQTGIQKVKELSYKHITVLGHPNFYPKFGFVSSAQKGIQPPFPVPEEVFMVLELEENALNRINGKIVYPPAFIAVS